MSIDYLVILLICKVHFRLLISSIAPVCDICLRSYADVCFSIYTSCHHCLWEVRIELMIRLVNMSPFFFSNAVQSVAIIL